MAITKTNVYSSNTATELNNIYTYLLENAVPTYFDSVAFDNENLTISCYVGETEFLKFNSTLYYGVIVKLNNGTSKSFTAGSTAYYYIREFLKMPHAISFSSTENGRAVFTITKDNNNNTVVVILNEFCLGTTSNGIFCVNITSGTITSKTIYKEQWACGYTSICPMVVHTAEGAYLPYVYLMPFTQTTEAGMLDINGTKYLSNGIWCIKDE